MSAGEDTWPPPLSLLNHGQTQRSQVMRVRERGARMAGGGLPGAGSIAHRPQLPVSRAALWHSRPHLKMPGFKNEE